MVITAAPCPQGARWRGAAREATMLGLPLGERPHRQRCAPAAATGRPIRQAARMRLVQQAGPDQRLLENPDGGSKQEGAGYGDPVGTVRAELHAVRDEERTRRVPE